MILNEIHNRVLFSIGKLQGFVLRGKEDVNDRVLTPTCRSLFDCGSRIVNYPLAQAFYKYLIIKVIGLKVSGHAYAVF